MLPSAPSKCPEAKFPLESSRIPASLLDRYVSRWILWLVIASCSWEHTSRLLPKSERNRHGIDVGFVPPQALVTLTVKLAMMDAAQRHRELIRYPAAERARLCEPKMVGLAGLPATHGARLNRNEAKMIFVARAARLHQGEVIGSFDAYS